MHAAKCAYYSQTTSKVLSTLLSLFFFFCSVHAPALIINYTAPILLELGSSCCTPVKEFVDHVL